MVAEVGESPMKKIKVTSRDKTCAMCGHAMVEEIAAPDKGQLAHDAKLGRFHMARVYCPRGCHGGWKPRR